MLVNLGRPVLVSFFALALVLGCSGDDNAGPTDSGNGGTGGDTLAADGVYAVLTVCRGAMRVYQPPYLDTTMLFDVLVARFDSSVAPCTPYRPLQPAGVDCSQQALTWIPAQSQFQYPEIGGNEFVVPGSEYIFTVTGNGDVPSMTDSITFPDHSPCITFPLLGAVVSRTGFHVTWSDAGSGDVYLSLLAPADSTDFVPGDTLGLSGVFVLTDNDGEYSFSGSQLASLTNGQYLVVLNHFNMESIDRPGYDSRSFIVGKVTSSSLVTLQ